ncbi:MAG: NAD(P)H-dependent glycerol-3-phosphate dehydrogenase [Bacteroidota bacterium]
MPSKSTSHNYVGVIGAGNFGTTIATLLARNTDVLLYVHRQKDTQEEQPIRTAVGHPLAPNITPTYRLDEIAERCTVLFPVVPSEAFRDMLKQIAPWLKPHHILIHGTKGLDVRWPRDIGSDALLRLAREDVKTMSELIQAESVVDQVGCLSGPNLARELAQGQPAGTVIASSSAAVIAQGQQLLRNPHFQVYSSTDLLGVELCGVFKNVIAIGAGCLSGLGYGENAKSLLISRGLVEMIYLGQAMGASVRPFIGLAGLGDLVATCNSRLSRNYALGYRLAQGTSPHHLTQNIQETAEGVNTVKIMRRLVNHYQMRAPIIEMIHRVLFEGLAAKEAIQHLMGCTSDRIDIDFL